MRTDLAVPLPGGSAWRGAGRPWPAKGALPARVVGQVFEWAQTHQAELLDDCALVEAHQPPLPIAPLT